MLRLAAFPRKGTPYTECLYAALRRTGIDVVEGDFSITWLTAHVKTIQCFHFHWPSFAYSYPGRVSTTLHHLARFILFLLIIRIHGRHILWTAHNLYPHDTHGWTLRIIDKCVRRVVVALASTIFVHGHTAARLVEAEFPGAARKLAIINHGHWVGHYENLIAKTDARRRLGIAAETFVFLFVGLCRRYKNLRELIASFNALPGDALLLIVGRFQDPGYEEEIADAARRAGERVRLVPRYVPDDSLQVYLKASDAVVLPYSDILTSGAAMLAISFGRPVAAPRKGHLSEFVREDCGVLYDSADPRGLLGALQQIRARSFDEGRILQYALTHDWGAAAEVIHRACESLCSGSRCATPPIGSNAASSTATEHR